MKSTRYILDAEGQLTPINAHTGQPAIPKSNRAQRVINKWLRKRANPAEKPVASAEVHEDFDPEALHNEHLKFDRIQRAKATKRFSAYGKKLRTNLAAPFIIRLRREANDDRTKS